MQLVEEKRVSWLDRPLAAAIRIDWDLVLFTVLLILAVFTRFYGVGDRVMSHDENSHVYYSWRFYRGYGFQHDPLMHGPLQFHLLAATFFLLGDNDFTARIPAVLFSIATVAFTWKYRRYLGRAGRLVAGALMLISPYMLFYGRYVRNEAFIGLFGVVTLWAILRYLETGEKRYAYWLTAAMVLHFTSKETSFIYMAQALVFLALYLVYRLSKNAWLNAEHRKYFLAALMAAVLLLGGAGITGIIVRRAATPAAPAAADAAQVKPAAPGGPLAALPSSGEWAIPAVLGVLGLIALGLAIYFVLRSFTLERLRRERSFDLLLLMGTLVLPQLSAFPVFFLHWNVPTNAGEVAALNMADIWHIAIFLVPLIILSIIIGLWWNRREWLINAAIWYIIFIVFYTSVFTNGAGFFTGIVGSLGYWLKQQGVNRGSQPWYYYILIQVPQYEFLPALGSLLALVLAIFGIRKAVETPAAQAIRPDGVPLQLGSDGHFTPAETSIVDSPPDRPVLASVDLPAAITAAYIPEEAPTFMLLAFWSITSLIAYTMAGEKMPWLTVHITLPMILLSGLSLGYLIDTTDWSLFRQQRGWLMIVLLPVFLASFLAAAGSLLGPNPPFQGKELMQLQDTSTFIFSLLMAAASAAGVFFVVRSWPVEQLNRVLTLFFIAFLGILTARASIRANYYNFNNANELLVYAHAAGGVKQALSQIEEISLRTKDGLVMPVAYDNETSYPYLWYFRNFSDARFYGSNPTRSLRDVPVILVGDANYGKIEPVVGQAYDKFEYVRLWWPNQDYYDLTPERIWYALTNPNMRNAIFQVWFNADYTDFGKVKGQDMSLPNWQPAARMRLYVRKDIVASLWNYGSAATNQPVKADPYEGKQVILNPDRVLGSTNGQAGTLPGQFQKPRKLVVAPDGSLYVADTANHRIQHLAADGTVLQSWGSFTGSGVNPAPASTFNEPWGLALGPDGSVYVADTWNHRIQKFTAEGKFVTAWGYFGQAEKPEAFWGPRDVAVDAKGDVFIADTGNKRIVVFDSDGNYLSQVGGAGLEPGKFDEPVGIAVSSDGRLFVADTWNQRIQVLQRADDGSYHFVTSWDVAAWYGQSLDNKPYIALDQQGNVFISDPEGYRVIEFTNKGEIVRFWGDYSTGADGFGLVGSVAPDNAGGAWVSDAGNNRLLHFKLP